MIILISLTVIASLRFSSQKFNRILFIDASLEANLDLWISPKNA